VGPSHQDIHDEERIDTREPGSTIAAIVRFFRRHHGRLRGIGLCSFGPLELDPRRGPVGTMLRTPKPGWSGVSLRGELEDALGVPVAVETDVNAAAIAETRWGAAVGAESCAYVTVGTGIGVGVVIAGRPIHGLLHPELGHLHGDGSDTFAGVCPFHGACIEGLASAPALRARLGMAPEGAPDDHPVWNVEGSHLAALVSACVLAYSPERVVLGGGVMQRRGLLSRVHTGLTSRLAGYVPRPELTPEGLARFVVPPAFGMRAGLIGAFALVS
jgi:fructokinase